MALGNPSDIATGMAITFQTGFIAQLLSVDISGFGERSNVDVSYSTITNGWRQKLPGDLKDPGTLDVNVNFLTNSLAALKTAQAAAKETTTLTFPIPADGGTSAGTIAMKAFLMGCDIALPIKDEDVMTNTLHLAGAGEPTMTDAT